MKESILIITGMHRSGTSLTASLLKSAGLNIGERLMAGALSNVKGHFENLDFVEFHESILDFQGLSKAGWTLQNDIDVPQEYIEKAKQLVEKNKSESCWGWKDPRTTLLLDFWADLLPQAKFLFIYRSPTEVVDSLYRRGDEVFDDNPTLAVELWMHYNKKILNFLNKHPDRCLILNIYSIAEKPELLLKALEKKNSIFLGNIEESIYDEQLLQNLNGNHSALINYLFPEAFNIYKELNAKGGYINDNDAFCSAYNDSYSVEKFYFQHWLDLRRKERELEASQSQLQQTQGQLEASQSQLQQTQGQLEASQSQLQQTQGQLENSQSQLHQTEEKLKTSQSQLHQIQGQLENSQSQLHQTEGQLENSQSQLHQTQGQLENSQSQWHDTQRILEQAQAEWYLTQGIIQAMETSKFWRLRKIWFKFKEAIGVKGN